MLEIWTKSIQHGELSQHVEEISNKNKIKTSFIGDGIKNYKVPKISSFVANVRGLSTAYTPYQPERSQGTLQSLWIYSSLMSMLTGFEAINASLYDRSTAIFEALKTATRVKRGKNRVLVSNAIYPGDREVLETLGRNTTIVN